MSTEASEHFPCWVFDTAFPFSFAWDSTWRITGCGRSLRRFLPAPSMGMAVTDHFSLVRPSGKFDAAWVNSHKDTLMLIDVIGTGLMLRGQVLAASADGPWLFAGSPWLKSPEDLDALGLSLGDFAPHDSSVDMLYVVQSQRVGNKELLELNDRLDEQGKLLTEKEQQARKLALVAEKTSGAVIITDSSGRIEWVNDAFAGMTGWHLEEIRGRKPGAFLQGKHSDRAVVSLMRSRIAEGQGFSVEILNYRKDGTPFWNSMEVQPVSNSYGVVSHFIALGSDVTETKLKELHRRIETVVAEVITAGSGAGSIIPVCLERLAQTLGANQGRWWRANAHDQELISGETWGLSQAGGMTRAKPSSLARQARAAGSSQWKTDFPENEGVECAVTSSLAIPVAVENRFFGVLEFSLRFVILPDAGTLGSLTRFGSQIGMLIRRLEAEEAYKGAERIAHLGNWSLDVASGRIEWSDEKYRIYGYEPREVKVDMDFCVRAMHPEDVDAVNAALAGSIETGFPMDAIYRIKRPSGEIRYLKCNAEALPDTEGCTTALIGTVMDITELEHARSALRETEERWQLALESMGLGVWDWDLESGTVIYTDALLAMLGYDSGDWGKQPDGWTSRMHPDDHATATAAMALCLTGESREYVSEHRMLCKNGGWKWVQQAGRVVASSPEGVPLRMVGTQMDIQIRKAAEQASRKRAELLNRIRTAQGHFIAIAGLEKVFDEMIGIAVSYSASDFGFIAQIPDETTGESAVKFYGIPDATLNDETVGRVDLVGADGSVFLTCKELFTAVLGSGEAVMAHARKAGSREGDGFHGNPCVENFLGVPVFHGLEKVGVIGLINRIGGYDQDFLKELDPFIAAIGSMIVADRDEIRRSKVEGELRTARDRAEAANRAKGDFLAMMSHEIRTPMNGVLGMAGLLRETPLSPPQLDMIDTVIQSGGALIRIIDDILDFSKVEAGLIHLKQEDVSLEDLLDGVVDLLAQDAVSKGLELITIIHADLPNLFQGDFGRLRQVLLNLAGNAVKFTERGYVAIRVTPVIDGLEFSVIDSGIGIAPGNSELIFQPFRQIDSSASRQAGGTGLGLSICKKLVSMMGGRIGLRSGNPGSEFWFRIPINAPPRAERPSWHEEARIWIADPMPLLRESILMAMGGEKATTLEIASQDDLIRNLTAGSTPPDVLFIDGKWLTPRTQSLIDEKWHPDHAQAPSVILTRAHAAGNQSGHLCLSRPLRRRSIRDAAFPQAGSVPTTPATESTLQPLGLKVLIAEDNPVNAMLIKLYLDRIGCEWILATDGIDAVRKFEEDHFDAILMDCQMPGMDGYEATKHIREIEKNRSRSGEKVCIIAVTANALEGERIRCLEAGMDDYIAKPFDPHFLAEILLKHTFAGG